MKKWGKKMQVLLCLLSMVILAAASGCSTQKLDQQASKDADAWMEEENRETQNKTENKEAAKEEEEYYDISNVEGEEKDYSKYEDKNTEGDNRETEGNVEYSDGTQTGQDEYGTDPVPEGKQNPVEPEDAEVHKDNANTCYFSISCSTVLDNMDKLAEGKESIIPSDGMIYAQKEVTFYEGETVFDILQRETRNNRIHMEFSFTPGYNSNYIEGIGNLYEKECGSESGWMYSVNDWYPNYGCSRYAVQPGDVIEWNFTCDLGRDLGAEGVEQL